MAAIADLLARLSEDERESLGHLLDRLQAPAPDRETSSTPG